MTQGKTSPSSRSSSKTQPRRSKGRPTQENVAEIETRLLKVALDEFIQAGYGGASLTRIVRNAGISKTTLYSRYSSKEELFRAIAYQQIERMSPARLLSSTTGDVSLEAGLKSYANHTLKLSLEPDMLEVYRLMHSESSRFPELGAAARERTELGIKRISRFIAACAERDGIPCKNPAGVAEVFILMIRGWYVDVMVSNEPASSARRKDWVERSVNLLLAARQAW
jgi:TetR/AcrR family transcriptional regulator, mexJK operon transcriptional repressor